MQNHGFCTYEVGCAGHFTVYIEIKLLILHLNNVKSVPYVCLIQSTSDRKIYTIYMTSHIIHGLSNTMRKEQERVENWHLIMRISCSRRFMSYCCLRVIELTFHRECVTHKWREYYWRILLESNLFDLIWQAVYNEEQQRFHTESSSSLNYSLICILLCLAKCNIECPAS
jgi:hypothetical protein